MYPFIQEKSYMKKRKHRKEPLQIEQQLRNYAPFPFIIMAMFACLIIRTFKLVFSVGTMFFSHDKSAETVFRLVFSAKRTDQYIEDKLRAKLESYD